MTHSMPAWAERLAVFDTETTGVYPASARVVSATVALIDSVGTAVERYDWLIDPGIAIPEQAARVHGITTELARANGMSAASGIEQIVGRLQEVLARGYPLVVYNAPYDLTLLRYEAARYGLVFPKLIGPVIDPLVVDKQVDRYRKGKRTLTAAAEHYGVALEVAHDSGADAIAAGQVLQALARIHGDKLPHDAREIHSLQVEWARTQTESFQEYMRRVKDPSFTAEGGWPVR